MNSAGSPRATVRTPVIAGNWKLNKGPRACSEYFRAFSEACPPQTARSVLFFPPSVSLTTARDATRDRPDLQLGVQNVYWEAEGAFTGEISAPMAAEAGASFALVGHSERRHVFGETDADVGRKSVAALDAGLLPLICVGETLAERRAGQLEDVLRRQLSAALEPLAVAVARSVLVAYEPVWAIGTGVNATPADAAAAHGFLRSRLADRLGDADARTVPILYGGSVKPENARDLLLAPDVDGLLVGGASLDPAGFARIATVEISTSPR